MRKSRAHSRGILMNRSARDQLWMEKRQSQIEKTKEEKRSWYRKGKIFENPEKANEREANQKNLLLFQKPNPIFSPAPQILNIQNYYQNLSPALYSQINFNPQIKQKRGQNFYRPHHQNFQLNQSKLNFNENNRNQNINFQLRKHNQNMPLNFQERFLAQQPQRSQIKMYRQIQGREQIRNGKHISHVNAKPRQVKQIASKLAENYNILTRFKNHIVYSKVLGSGTYSKVYLGLQLITQTKVAVKQISELQQNQINCLMSVNSPYVIQLKAHWRNDSNKMTYLVLDLCRGNLREQLKKYQKDKAIKYFDDIVQGMNALFEKNILHRDLKFQNILVSFDGTAKITDFGLAKDLGNMSNVASIRCGTPYTMAPQILFHNGYGKARYSHKCDIWSIGVILHEMLYQKHPFNYDSQRVSRMERVKINRSYGFYDQLIDRSLVKCPQRRIGWTDFKKIYDRYKTGNIFQNPMRKISNTMIPEENYQRQRIQANQKIQKNIVFENKKKSPAPIALAKQQNRRKISDIIKQIDIGPKESDLVPEQKKIDVSVNQIAEQKRKPAKNIRNIKFFQQQKQKNKIRILKEQEYRDNFVFENQKYQQNNIIENKKVQIPKYNYQYLQKKQVKAHTHPSYAVEKLTLSFFFFAIIFIVAKICSF